MKEEDVVSQSRYRSLFLSTTPILRVSSTQKKKKKRNEDWNLSKENFIRLIAIIRI